MYKSEIEVRGDLEDAIKRIRRYWKESGIARELEKRKGFLTKSQKRKIKDGIALKRLKRKLKRLAAGNP
jgi:ribosomal protein S21